MEHDSWAPSFWRSLVALPLPLQSYCQGNSERAARHLVHYHTAMVSGSGEGWYLMSWIYCLSLWQGLFAVCSFRYTNSFSRVKLFGDISQDCLQLITAVIESGLLFRIFMNWGWWFFFFFSKIKPGIVTWRMSASVWAPASWKNVHNISTKTNDSHAQQQWSQRPDDLQLLDDDSPICLCLTDFPSWLYCHLVIWGNYTDGWNKQQAFKHWIGNVMEWQLFTFLTDIKS